MPEQDLQPLSETPDKYRYTGLSMRPTFKPGQVLYTRPLARGLQPGDVVVYQGSAGFVVHRVTAVSGEGFYARGDSNPFDDPGPIPFERVMGVVDHADNWGRMTRVAGGVGGLMRARLRWLLSSLWQKILPVAGAPYRWLKRSGWVQRFWHPNVQQVLVHTRTGKVVKYTVRGKTVAAWEPDLQRFACRKPYDLVIFPPQEPLEK